VDLRIEIAGEQALCRQDGVEAYSAPLGDFLAELAQRSDYLVLPEPIPEGVRSVRGRGDAVTLVIETQPSVRTVRWLADESPVPFGKNAVYRTACLAFPFVILIVTFRAGGLTGLQQCFYRTEPLEKFTDSLLLPNLYNVAEAYGQKCWLCLANLQTDLRPLCWNEKVRVLRSHLWGGAWNKSSEHHEGNSYWGTMRGLDPRLKSLGAWEKATRQDPLFALKVQWKPLGRTVTEIVDEMLAKVAPRPTPVTAAHLAQVLSLSKNQSAQKTLFSFRL